MSLNQRCIQIHLTFYLSFFLLWSLSLKCSRHIPKIKSNQVRIGIHIETHLTFSPSIFTPPVFDHENKSEKVKPLPSNRRPWNRFISLPSATVVTRIYDGYPQDCGGDKIENRQSRYNSTHSEPNLLRTVKLMGWVGFKRWR